MASMLDRKQFEKDHLEKNYPQMKPFNMTYHGQTIERITNVWLDVHGKEQFVQNINMYTNEKTNVPTIGKQKGPALIYISAGAWFTHPHVITTGNGTDPWEERYDLYKNHVISLSNLVGENTPEHDPFTAPMDPYDGIGNQILYAPPAGPRYLGNDAERKLDRNRRADEVIEMQKWLHDHEDKMSIPLMWSIPGLVVGQDKIWRDPLRTGFHVKFHVAELRANILFNMRCNAKLDRIKSYPYSRTCCTDYGIKTFTQLAVVYLGTMYLIVCILCELLDLVAKRPRDEPRWSLFNMRAGCFVLALLMCYYADRTQMMAKGSKLWQMKDFVALSIAWIAVLIFSIRRSDYVGDSWSMQHVTDQHLLSQPDSIQDSADHPFLPQSESFKHSITQPFLSRDQMDEWKGWMQCFILTYHWTGAQDSSIDTLFHLCVCGYLFQAIFKTQWNGKEWQYHIMMNTFIVYIGMLTAIMHREMKKAKVSLDRGLRITLALGGLLAIVHYLYVTPTLVTDAYEKWYPYLSSVPILAFLALRNVSTCARNHHSKAMAWLGRCYLETYILQTHLLLAADNNGILIVDGLFGDGTLLGDRWRTLVVVAPIFLWISHAVADSTAYIVKMVLHESATSKKTGWLGKVPGCSNITAPQIRIACILLIMWSLNLITPGHEVPAAPNGRHEVSVVKSFPKQRPSLVPFNGTTW
ncbi:hypothetical protein NW768_004824 [Fusarium equiseti]|uniref:Cas1p 10 TM acyl transferase domain-containing protein n=1 Tax=Fusarium equiseti TaxID=61235 RepID=A0ABQ8RHE8_FUSEQ|nr:hypothetical protein NW768_004824 [Fusarium equiseti]